MHGSFDERVGIRIQFDWSTGRTSCGKPSTALPAVTPVTSAYSLASSQPFQYKGQYGYYTEGGSGLIYCQNRFYDPNIGRWLSRDPAGLDGGINVYEYCEGNPISFADPSGLVIIRVISYRVFAYGWHRGIVVIDNIGHEKPYSFAGGPERFGIAKVGHLVSHSGPWLTGTMDYDKWHKQPTGDRRTMTLVDDNSPAKHWIDKFKAIEADIASKPPQDYAPLPTDGLHLWGGATANSNTWAHYLLLKAGLMKQYSHAISKLPGGDLPWAPGWNIKVPYNDAPHP